MPRGFDECVRKNGRVRTIKHGANKYQHICFIGGKSYAGEVKTKKAERGSLSRAIMRHKEA